MGFLDRFRRGTKTVETRPSKAVDLGRSVFVGASREADEQQIQSFSNSNITYSGELSGFDYTSILKDKQANIVSLYQLADYYSDADSIIRGIIKHVYVPFSTNSLWYLTGAKMKTVKLFEDYYKKMRLREKLDGVMLEYWKYNNVFIYLMNGQIITLPPHKCKIGNVALNGLPIVDYDCQSILNEWRAKSYQVRENWIKDNDLEEYFKGYPEEIQEALNKGSQYAQLNPENTFVMQGSKESWQRYAIPFIAACLPALAKKELISKYEDSILNLGIRSFIHVTYGDKTKGQDILPDREQLTAVRRLFQQGMSGFPLVTTNHLAEAKVIHPDMDDLFQWDKYKVVNRDILSAGGVSEILVSGLSEDGSTFASAQISMQTAEARIEAAREEFCEIMTRINARLTEYIDGTYNLKEIPEFHFQPLDMSGKKAIREACKDLWSQGLVSTKTMVETHGYSLDLEREQREKEASDGTDEIMIPRDVEAAAASEDSAPNDSEGKKDGPGRPELEDDEKMSDPENALRSKQPKPSSPEGSLGDEVT